MKAVILAGGLGTRLQSVVSDRPKPLATIAGVPFVELQLRFLQRHFGIAHFVLCVSHKAEMIREHLGDGERIDCRIEYAVEREPLGTAGAIKNAEPLLRDDPLLLVCNGDTFVEVDLAALTNSQTERSRQGESLGTICLWRTPSAAGKGVVEVDENGRIRRFAEKVSEGAALVNAGVYCFDPIVLSRIPTGRPVSLERETLPALLDDGLALYGFETQGRLIDIGTPADYERAQQELGDIADAAQDERAGPR